MMNRSASLTEQLISLMSSEGREKQQLPSYGSTTDRQQEWSSSNSNSSDKNGQCTHSTHQSTLLNHKMRGQSGVVSRTIDKEMNERQKTINFLLQSAERLRVQLVEAETRLSANSYNASSARERMLRKMAKRKSESAELQRQIDLLNTQSTFTQRVLEADNDDDSGEIIASFFPPADPAFRAMVSAYMKSMRTMLVSRERLNCLFEETCSHKSRIAELTFEIDSCREVESTLNNTYSDAMPAIRNIVKRKKDALELSAIFQMNNRQTKESTLRMSTIGSELALLQTKVSAERVSELRVMSRVQEHSAEARRALQQARVLIADSGKDLSWKTLLLSVFEIDWVCETMLSSGDDGGESNLLFDELINLQRCLVQELTDACLLNNSSLKVLNKATPSRLLASNITPQNIKTMAAIDSRDIWISINEQTRKDLSEFLSETLFRNIRVRQFIVDQAEIKKRLRSHEKTIEDLTAEYERLREDITYLRTFYDQHKSQLDFLPADDYSRTVMSMSEINTVIRQLSEIERVAERAHKTVQLSNQSLRSLLIQVEDLKLVFNQSTREIEEVKRLLQRNYVDFGDSQLRSIVQQLLLNSTLLPASLRVSVHEQKSALEGRLAVLEREERNMSADISRMDVEDEQNRKEEEILVLTLKNQIKELHRMVARQLDTMDSDSSEVLHAFNLNYFTELEKTKENVARRGELSEKQTELASIPTGRARRDESTDAIKATCNCCCTSRMQTTPMNSSSSNTSFTNPKYGTITINMDTLFNHQGGSEHTSVGKTTHRQTAAAASCYINNCSFVESSRGGQSAAATATASSASTSTGKENYDYQQQKYTASVMAANDSSPLSMQSRSRSSSRLRRQLQQLGGGETRERRKNQSVYYSSTSSSQLSNSQLVNNQTARKQQPLQRQPSMHNTTTASKQRNNSTLSDRSQVEALPVTPFSCWNAQSSHRLDAKTKNSTHHHQQKSAVLNESGGASTHVKCIEVFKMFGKERFTTRLAYDPLSSLNTDPLAHGFAKRILRINFKTDKLEFCKVDATTTATALHSLNAEQSYKKEVVRGVILPPITQAIVSAKKRRISGLESHNVGMKKLEESKYLPFAIDIDKVGKLQCLAMTQEDLELIQSLLANSNYSP